ncbi:carboxypeptidase regulatory-like domain-containing protein [Paraburkholderia sp. CNPSo 3157]|uniref:Carboxypeptidase regulatory-like domain-containing protein n=1 Tax=Paraburkholderia franconis TaxID=2654983 RepID=A0A7X1TGA5_9BURK|nr:carboxypeptidase regulatory-like domain-containing protein [Paraburkholderia franconis]MPW18193.1 carboxypeptidase regulatory-like domain-containing protein [Paraburkholderia franconis]
MNSSAKAGLLLAITLVLAQSANIAFAATPILPPLQHQGNVAYLSGGVGSDQSAALKDEMHKYPLVLEFAGKTHQGNEYLADIPVHITDMHGATLLNATSHGPFMLASLPDGRYRITVSYEGNTQQRVVDVKPSTHVRTLFLWPTHTTTQSAQADGSTT